MTNKHTLLIRVDASPEIGIGHFMRTLALAQAWQRAGHNATFMTRSTPDSLASLWEPFGVAVMDRDHEAGSERDADVTIEIAKEINADCIVIDGYQFGDEYQKAISRASIKQLFIDDMGHCGTYHANKIVNPNAHANKLIYRTKHYRPVLGGTKYTMLRQQFYEYSLHRPTIPNIATNVLVMLGGGNSGMLMSRILDALVALNAPFDIVALVNPRTANLYHMTQLPRVTPLSEVYDVASLMKNAHIAISGGGMTVWELAYMGVPTICLGRGPQEKMLIAAAVEIDIVEDGGSANDLYPSALAMQVKQLATNASKRKKMANLGQVHVDGSGAERVVDVILEDINAEK